MQRCARQRARNRCKGEAGFYDCCPCAPARSQIRANGNCLYCAIAYTLFGDQKHAWRVRKAVVDTLRRALEETSADLSGLRDDIANAALVYELDAAGREGRDTRRFSARDYTDAMAKDKMYGGELELAVRFQL
jgi:hypothetical protein